MANFPDQHPLSRQIRSAFHARQFDSCERLYEEFVGIFPESAETSFLLGLLERSRQHPKISAEAFAKALALDPKRYDAQIELAAQYSVLQEPNKAIELLGTLPEGVQKSPLYLNLAGSIYSELALPQRAYPLFKAALVLQPKAELIKANLAACAVFMGDIEFASQLYRELLTEFPLHQRYHYYLSRLAKAKDRTHVEEMLAVASKFPEQRNVFINFALGKELEDLGEFEDSFRHYKLANDAAKQLSGYEVKTDLELADSVLQSYSTCPAFKPKRRHEMVDQIEEGEITLREPCPIFLVGLPRSGTTLLERIMSSHSKVGSIGETQYIDTAIRKTVNVITDDKFNLDIGHSLNQVAPELLGENYKELIQYLLPKNKSYFIEKLPWNFLYVGYLLRSMPNARIVWMNRLAEDSCFAMYKQPFTWAYKYSYNLRDVGSYYKKFKEVQSFWQKRCGDNIFFTDYETLVSVPEETVKSLCKYLNLDFEPQMLDFHRSNIAPSTTASSVQIRSSINQDSVAKWKHYEPWLGELLETLAE